MTATLMSRGLGRELADLKRYLRKLEPRVAKDFTEHELARRAVSLGRNGAARLKGGQEPIFEMRSRILRTTRSSASLQRPFYQACFLPLRGTVTQLRNR